MWITFSVCRSIYASRKVVQVLIKFKSVELPRAIYTPLCVPDQMNPDHSVIQDSRITHRKKLTMVWLPDHVEYQPLIALQLH